MLLMSDVLKEGMGGWIIKITLPHPPPPSVLLTYHGALLWEGEGDNMLQRFF